MAKQKITGWSALFADGNEGFHMVTVQAENIEEAVRAFKDCGFRIQKADAIRQTVTVQMRHAKSLSRFEELDLTKSPDV